MILVAGAIAAAWRGATAVPVRLAKGGARITRVLTMTVAMSVSQAGLAAPPGVPSLLTVDQAVLIALRDSQDIGLARLAVASADAGIQIAAANPNPSLTIGTSGINPSVGIGSGNLRSKTVDSSARVDQLIERGGKRALRIENASALKVASQHDFREAQRQLAIAVRQAFYDLLAAQQRVIITAESASLSEATMRAAKQREKAGDLAPSDVTRLQVDALRADNDVTQAKADQARARLTLLQLMGHGDLSETVIADDAWPGVDHAVDPDVDAAITQRADVRAAQARLSAALAASELALAARTRDITVGVQYDHFPASATNTQGGGNTFGIAVQIPLFWRNQFNGEIRSAALAAETARETFARIRLAARNELMRLLSDQRSATERLARFDDTLLPAAKKSADATEFAFKHGAIGIMDVLDVRRTYRLTQLDALAARADHAKLVASIASFSLPGERP